MNNASEPSARPHDDRHKKLARASQPTTRKSRSISRYFLGTKRSSCDVSTQDADITRCLTSIGIFDAHELWTTVTLFRDHDTCRRLLIITNKNELIIGKSNSKQSLFKIKQRIDLHRLWLYTTLQHSHDHVALDITSLTYYDSQRSCIIGWPLAENFVVEFDSKTVRDVWIERIQL